MKREGVRIIEADGTVTFENGVTGIRFDLKKGHGAPESVEKNRF